MKFTETIPLSLYIHMPWCIRKCPYCDFNSHQAPLELQEKEYIDALIRDLENDLPRIWGRRLVSIFIGGGTPSLFSAHGLDKLLTAIRSYLGSSPSIEITMEANPGSFEQQRFKDYVDVGINRLSIGIQSFNNQHLQKLGRIHDGNEALTAVGIAKLAGFENINLDLMHGLPNQTIDDAMTDLQMALDLKPSHLSWYQLTLEPNTVFYKHPPPLPSDNLIWDMQQQGQLLLNNTGYFQYEVSAYAQNKKQCIHNKNYWEFGDYLGIGAGAHSKLTDMQRNVINRFAKKKMPNAYMSSTDTFIAEEKELLSADVVFEFMLNAFRLNKAISMQLFSQRTGLCIHNIQEGLDVAKNKGFLDWNQNNILISEHGRNFLNDLIEIFIPTD